MVAHADGPYISARPADSSVRSRRSADRAVAHTDFSRGSHDADGVFRAGISRPPAFAVSATGLDYEALFQYAPMGYLLTDDNGVITNVNETFLIWAGHSRADRLNTPLHALFPAGDQSFYTMQCVPQLTLVGAVSEIALEVVGKDGARRAALLSANRVSASDTTPAMVRVGIFGAHQRLR
ncbi:PAS domain-containing protein [Arthrobacter sp. HLT1-21]